MSKQEERRLVDYFVIVSSEPRPAGGSSPTSSQNNIVSSADDSVSSTASARSDAGIELVDNNDFQAIITAQYPLNDHKDNPLPESVTAFCHPIGSIHPRTKPVLPKVHYFVSTGSKGQQLYGVCLTVYETHSLPPLLEKCSENGHLKTKSFYLPKCICILSSYPYLLAFREYLIQLHRLSGSGEMTVPIERYIVNFCAEIPAPPPGSFEVQTTILDSIIKFWSPPHNQPIVWVSLPFSYLLECLDIENILLVWHALSLERQVLFTSTQLSLLTICCEILISLLFPMKWSHAYIPILPHSLIPILSAPMPYLCGIDKTNLTVALCDLSGDCVMVDLDKNMVTMGPSTPPLPPLPSAVSQSLKSRLENNVGNIFREVRSLTKEHDYSDRGLHLPDDVKAKADAMWESRLSLFDEATRLSFTPQTIQQSMLNGNDSSGIFAEQDLSNHGASSRLAKEGKHNLRKQSQWDAMQEAFLDAYVFLLCNHRKFLVFPSKDNEGSYGGAGFRSKEFVEAQRSEMQPFLAELVGTQMFDDFVTKRLYGSGEADVAFFDLAVDRLMKNPSILADHGITIGTRRTSIPAYVERRGPDLRASWQRVASLRSLGNVSGRNSRSRSKSPPPNIGSAVPLLQSASVHRKLKTIVCPEPSGAGLSQRAPNNPLVVADGVNNDDAEVGLTNFSDAPGACGTESATISDTPISGRKQRSDSMADRHFYVYPSFPSKLDTNLFGKPRPLSSAILAEFDKQREKASMTASNEADGLRSHLQKVRTNVGVGGIVKEKPPSPEVTTFTVFFLVFTAVVGKDLFELSSDSQSKADDRTILSTYSPDTHDKIDSKKEAEFNNDTTVDVSDPERAFNLTHRNGEIKPGEANNEDRPQSDESQKPHNARLVTPTGNESPLVQSIASEKRTKEAPRSRFKDKLSDLQIQEAKATAKAQLGLAFEMLSVMKKRGLKGEPAAYQCLIDACGRCGDTERATQLLSKMHDDGIVADGVVYSWLVSAFSTEQNALRQISGKSDEALPDWANGASGEVDWNKLQKRSYIEFAKERLGKIRLGGDGDTEATLQQSGLDEDDSSTSNPAMTLKKALSRRKLRGHHRKTSSLSSPPSPIRLSRHGPERKNYVSEPVLRQIVLGENLLEIVFPGISIDTDNELCPKCNTLLSDDDIVSGWSSADSQEYTTKCIICARKFLPHFRVRSTSKSFMGSKGMGTPLLCERLSPWVLLKELRSVMSDREGIEELLSPEWRDQERKNSVLWWNLILSFLRYRFPFSFLLQGSFGTNLIAPLPVDDTY